jgi:hypothetical protein
MRVVAVESHVRDPKCPSEESASMALYLNRTNCSHMFVKRTIISGPDESFPLVMYLVDCP